MVTAGCRGGEKKTPVTARNHLTHVLQKNLGKHFIVRPTRNM